MEDISFNHTSVSTVNAEYFNSFRNCFENNCASGSVHTRGIPTTSQPGHGLGVRSICAIVEQYGGMYSFSQQQDQFVLRISL